MGLKLDGATLGRAILLAEAAAAAAFSASSLAALRAALLLVLGGMEGAQTLLGRGRSLAAGVAALFWVGDVDRGRLPATEEARGMAYRDTGACLACDAGRAGGGSTTDSSCEEFTSLADGLLEILGGGFGVEAALLTEKLHLSG